MKQSNEKRILVALDLTHQSGREHLIGFYRYADSKTNWEVRLVPSTEESYLPMVERILADSIDGVIMKGECVQPLAAAIDAAAVSVVAIDQPMTPSSEIADVYICNDNEKIGQAAARYFDSLGRFASYGFVPDPNDCEWSKQRGSAFINAATERHHGQLVCTAVDPLNEWIDSLPKPAAVFAAFDQCASTVLAACRELKLKVPRDVAVLGVDDDILICNHTRPQLTSIRPDHAGQGFAAAKELDRLMSSPKSCLSRTVVCPHIGITERDSTTVVPPAVHLVHSINTYLDEHALEGIRVSDVVKHLGVSMRLANLRYAQSIGHSIQKELTDRRLSEAKRLLTQTKYPIERIAKRCGFSSSITFSHLFRTYAGIAPTAYRNDCKVKRTHPSEK